MAKQTQNTVRIHPELDGLEIDKTNSTGPSSQVQDPRPLQEVTASQMPVSSPARVLQDRLNKELQPMFFEASEEMDGLVEPRWPLVWTVTGLALVAGISWLLFFKVMGAIFGG